MENKRPERPRRTWACSEVLWRWRGEPRASRRRGGAGRIGRSLWAAVFHMERHQVDRTVVYHADQASVGRVAMVDQPAHLVRVRVQIRVRVGARARARFGLG